MVLRKVGMLSVDVSIDANVLVRHPTFKDTDGAHSQHNYPNYIFMGKSPGSDDRRWTIFTPEATATVPLLLSKPSSTHIQPHQAVRSAAARRRSTPTPNLRHWYPQMLRFGKGGI